MRKSIKDKPYNLYFKINLKRGLSKFKIFKIMKRGYVEKYKNKMSIYRRAKEYKKNIKYLLNEGYNLKDLKDIDGRNF
jgi:hypothetical protein